jgi:hypothetical protein
MFADSLSPIPPKTGRNCPNLSLYNHATIQMLQKQKECTRAHCMIQPRFELGTFSDPRALPC